eukprot:278984-Chlamydomonas_euryale.AAC.5
MPHAHAWSHMRWGVHDARTACMGCLAHAQPTIHVGSMRNHTAGEGGPAAVSSRLAHATCAQHRLGGHTPAVQLRIVSCMAKPSQTAPCPPPLTRPTPMYTSRDTCDVWPAPRAPRLHKDCAHVLP